MNDFIRYGTIQAIPLYNCSLYDPIKYPELKGEQRIIFGICCLIYGIIIVTIYLLVISVMLKRSNIVSSCYKIMVLLAIIDIFAIIITSVISGCLAALGAVFCSFPNLIYFSGSASLGLWSSSCILAFILVINRLMDIIKPNFVNFVFRGWRTYTVLIFTLLYGLYFIFFTRPILFNSKFMAWFFDPMIFPNMTHMFINVPHSMNNTMIISITSVIYIVFCFVLCRKVKNANVQNSQSRNTSSRIFTQAAIICTINMTASTTYALINLIGNSPTWLIYIAHVYWQLEHGSPALIYLFMNVTIRKGVLQRFTNKNASSIAVVSNAQRNFR